MVEGLSPDGLLVIVPHGGLHQLPFQALETDRGFLAHQAIIAYAPGLGVLGRLLARGAGKARDRQRQPALLLGIEEFGNGRPRLRWALREVDQVAAIYGEQSTCLRNGEATATALRSLSQQGWLRSCGTLHVASHAALDAASGALSSISLRDEDLTLVEVGRLRLGPSVVVLSACQSGLGEINAGDEIVSPITAFLGAGAQTVVASLWHVDDESTTELMASFHQHLRAGAAPAAALAEAQRAAIARGRTLHQWGAFVATGAP